MDEIIKNFSFDSEFWVIMLPPVLMFTDIITGLVHAWVNNEVKSSVMRQGLARKFGELVIIGIGELFVYATSIPSFVLYGMSCYIVIMELISICENLHKLGVPIPGFVKKALKDAEYKLSDEEKKGDEGDEKPKDS